MSLKDDFKLELERIAADMRHLGGTIKAKAKAADRGIKAAWAEVEPKIEKFETEASIATDKMVAELKKSGGDLVSQLKAIKDRLIGVDEAPEETEETAKAEEADASKEATDDQSSDEEPSPPPDSPSSEEEE